MFPRSTRTTASIALLAIILIAGAAAHAQGKKPTPSPTPAAQKDEKLDVSGLEKKYWSPKDDDYAIVQNRLYSKAGRFALTTNIGMYVGEPWSEGPTLGAQLSYFPQERYGYELAYSTTQSKDGTAVQGVEAQNGYPNHDKMKQFYGVAFDWVPFYAKMSVLNSSITYFDMSFSPGVGMVQYEQELQEGNARKWTPALTLDVTQHYFLNKYMAVRLDYKNRWYQQQVLEYRTSLRTDGSTELKRTDLLMIGLTFYY